MFAIKVNTYGKDKTTRRAFVMAVRSAIKVDLMIADRISKTLPQEFHFETEHVCFRFLEELESISADYEVLQG